MRVVSLTAVVVLAVAVVLPGDGPAPPEDQEIVRLQAHFDAVDAELRAAPISTLTPAQRAARARMIDWLRDYRGARAFPRNDRIHDRHAPFFRDSRGVLCAMAYLIARSGHTDLVDRIARTRNNAYIRELAGDAALVAWLRGAGLSVAEAARIQPDYAPVPVASPADAPVSDSYANTSLGLGLASLATAGWNLRSPSRFSGWAGVIAGSASALIGLRELEHESSETQRVAAANLLVGLVALTSAGIGFEVPSPQSGPAFRFAPAVLRGPDAPQPGLAFAWRF